MIQLKIGLNLGLIIIFKGLFILILGIIVSNNPSPVHYRKYATNYVVRYLDKNICTFNYEKLKNLWKRECKTLVIIGSPYIGQMIQKTTTRRNFVLFSIYQTDLIFAPPIPSYEFETIGIMNKFYTYDSGEF